MATIEQIRAYAATVTNGQTIERYNEFGDIVEVGFRTSEWVYAWFNVVTYVDGRTDCSYNYHYSQRTGKATKRKWDGRNLEKKIEACATSYNVVNESKLTSRYSEAYELTVKLVSCDIIEVAAEEVNATVNADGLAEVNNATLLKMIGKQVSANCYFTCHSEIEGGRATFKVCFFGEVWTVVVIFKDPTDQDPTDQDPTDQDPTDQDPTDQDPTDQDPTDQDPTDQDPDPAEPETAYKIQVKTNEYQAARNISFPRGCGTIWANEGTEYATKAEAVQALLQLAIYNSYGEPMSEPAELISSLIWEQSSAVGTSEVEYIRAHPRLIDKLAKLNGWEGPGVYEAGRLIYPEGSESHEYDGYYYKVIEITK